ncbi:type II toxin-antitoxin system RelE/ParE family toxin [Methylophilus sp. TWE2]|uniref:type II toxin-antitoxin system RelE family toxin n=1 Tax=Methylophilus sp. TWE2 TaxID=1662285 RepID=UPI00067107AF|nr:type II toxin-antitoxin system RelE/ParE family toxin [Methylophilus sp. TWE2]
MLLKSISEARAGELEEFKYKNQFLNALLDIWSPAPEQIPEEAEIPAENDRPLFSRRAPDPTAWAIAFTPTFLKSIANIDKKLQGRILLAITELSEDPIALVGDTKKPLVGEQKGLWRYRVGDYRLIYEPNEQTSKVVLLEFAARGSVYE